MLEDYRAGLGIDCEHDAADRAAGRRISSPVLMLWSEYDDLEDLHGDSLAIWRTWADEVSGCKLCGRAGANALSSGR
jgi:haloacetate dehalogenase